VCVCVRILYSHNVNYELLWNKCSFNSWSCFSIILRTDAHRHASTISTHACTHTNGHLRRVDLYTLLSLMHKTVLNLRHRITIGDSRLDLAHLRRDQSTYTRQPSFVKYSSPAPRPLLPYIRIMHSFLFVGVSRWLSVRRGRINILRILRELRNRAR
jgi:hypothetical protein